MDLIEYTRDGNRTVVPCSTLREGVIDGSSSIRVVVEIVRVFG